MAEAPVQLRSLSTLGVGGAPARYFRPASPAELAEAIEQCRREGLPWRVLGGGSNLLVEDGALPYAVVQVRAPGFDWIRRSGPHRLRVGAGVPVGRLLAHCRREGLGGLEFLAGLPGTVGGALAGNAGAWGRQVSEPLSRLWLFRPERGVRELSKDRIEFSYRSARLEGGIVVEAEFQLQPRSPELIARLMSRRMAERARRHPLDLPSAGCIFRNPPGRSAGVLLDRCGLKGLRAGGAAVSRRHANFIVNTGGASSRDVLRLIELMREAVRRRFDIELRLEVRHWPARAEVA